MHIEIWTIGKINDDNFNAAIKDYSQRITKFIKIEWHYFKNYTSDDKQIVMKKEADMIKLKLQNDDHLLVLDRANGKALDTQNLAKILQTNMSNSGIKRIIILIGGAYGIEPQLAQKSDTCISLSKLTFPHQLVRLIIAEQLYRAFTILNNIPYHN